MPRNDARPTNQPTIQAPTARALSSSSSLPPPSCVSSCAISTPMEAGIASSERSANPADNSPLLSLPRAEEDASMAEAGDSNRPLQGDSEMANRRALARRTEPAFVSMKRDIEALETMTVSELAAKHLEVFGVPTRTRNKGYLRRRVAWGLQEQQEGGLSPRALERIEQLAPTARARWNPPPAKHEEAPHDEPPRAAAPRRPRATDPRVPPPGQVLTRTYEGVEHNVTVQRDGFEYDGKIYRSLSQVAKRITGTPWNGFRFFFGNAAAGAPR